MKGNLPNVQSPGALVIDLDTGHELFSRRPDNPRAIASISKLAATLTVMDRSPDLDGLRPSRRSMPTWPAVAPSRACSKA